MGLAEGEYVEPAGIYSNISCVCVQVVPDLLAPFPGLAVPLELREYHADAWLKI